MRLPGRGRPLRGRRDRRGPARHLRGRVDHRRRGPQHARRRRRRRRRSPSAASSSTSQPFSGRVTLDNVSNAGDEGDLDELYIVNLGGGLGGGRVFIRDTGLGLGNDELIVNGTPGAGPVTLDAVGSGSTRTGSITFGDLNDPKPQHRQLPRRRASSASTRSAATTRVLSNDTAAVTLINLGEGDDEIVVGTVPLMPDPGNRTLEFPEGVPGRRHRQPDERQLEPAVRARRARQRPLRGQPQPRAALPARRRRATTASCSRRSSSCKENPDDPDEITNLAQPLRRRGREPLRVPPERPGRDQRRPRHRHDRRRRHADRRHLRRHRAP